MPGIQLSKEEESNLMQMTAGAKQKPIKQMLDGQKGLMNDGQHQEKFQGNKNAASSRTGQYITHKFVSFLSDVANQLNVDKLSIAEQLVKDVERTKQTPSMRTVTREANIVENVQNNKLHTRGIASLNQSIPREARQLKTLVEKTGSRKTLSSEHSLKSFHIGRKKPEVIKYIWNKGISVVRED